MNIHRLIFDSIIFGGLTFALITLGAEWVYGSATWTEPNIYIRGIETIMFVWAAGYWLAHEFNSDAIVRLAELPPHVARPILKYPAHPLLPKTCQIQDDPEYTKFIEVAKEPEIIPVKLVAPKSRSIIDISDLADIYH